jgi:Leucine-rich repeat (LRR) protein
LIPSVASSQIRGLSATRNELIKQQKEASIALQQVTAEYNDLERQDKNREKNAKIEIENKHKFEDLKIRHKELDEHFKGQRKRNQELDDYERDVKAWEEKIKTDEFNEQFAKEKEVMQMHIRSLQRQSHLTNERINHRNKRTAMLRDLTKDQEVASMVKIQMEEEQETYRYAKQREKLLRETNLASAKAKEYNYLTIAQNEHMEAMRLMEE